MHRSVLLLLLAASACGPLPPRPDPVTLPQAALPQGAGDPTRGAIMTAAFVFGQPASVAGNPAAAAEALAQLEYLTVQLDTDQRWIELNPTTQILLREARAEARNAFGINQATPPQQALNGLYAASFALREGDRERAVAALAPLTGEAGVPAALARLEALPFLPKAAFATSYAQMGMTQMDSGRRGGSFFLPR